MNPEEKAEKIKWLWNKVRSHVKQMQFINRTQKQLDKQFLS